ncbi:hypothetical protein [Pseudomonas aeruginosa]|uniref:hypothetical protein n=1 Tax=Pseudomonas aeruginosa TaxID=287 RepID=UPI00228B3F8D|nr:hypothetical protein [Pseudomonas aeruginosa]
MSSTQHQLIEQCATRLRGIIEALDNIHDTSPHRWSTDLDDVHSSAESLLALIKDQAPTLDSQGLAGAALAQPSPKCATCADRGHVCLDWEAGAWEECPDCAQAEVKLDFSRPLETENGEPVKWICADVIEYKSARVCVAKDTGLVYSSPYIGLKIRNVMPEQAEAEQPEVVAWRYGSSGGIVSDKACLDEWKSGGEYQSLMTVAQHERIVGALRFERQQMDRAFTACINERDAANARLHEVSTACATAEQERDAALARVAELERQEPVAWMHDQPNRVDVIHRDVKELLQRVPGSNRGIHRPLDVSEHYTIPLYAAPVAQAQHSVPEVSGIGRDFAYPRSVVLYMRTEPTDDDLRAIHDGLLSLAAAPGKEGL